MSAISEWSTTANSNNAAPPDGAPEGWAPSAVNNTIREIMAQVRAQMEDAEWFNWGDTLAYVSGTQFTVATDVTARYLVNRRIKVTGSTTGTIYGTITASSYSSPNTTVTVSWDSGSMQNETLTGYLAILSTNDAVPLGTFLKGAQNLSDLDSAATSRANLGVAIGSDVQAYDAATAKTDVAQSFTKRQGSAQVTLTDAATIAVDASLGNLFTVTLGDNRTLGNPSNLVAGFYTFIVKQDATGGRTLAFASAYKFPAGVAPTLSTGANDVDILYGVSDGTSVYIGFQQDFS